MWFSILLVAMLGLGADPVDLRPYLMSEAHELALARSAAPAGVGADAEVWVLSRSGYLKVANGTNGFMCMVQRSFDGPLRPDSAPEVVWNPRVRAPICYNELARPVFEGQLQRAERMLGGASVVEALAQSARGIADGSLRVPPPGAMAYMLSSGQYLGDRVKQGMPHLMLYQPYATDDDLGGRAARGVAFVLHGSGTPHAVVVVPVPDFVTFEFEGER